MVARLLLPALALPLALAACQEEPAAVAKPDRPVLVQTVAFEPRTPERSFVATIRPRVESDLGFRVAGKVARRLVQVGDRVKAGGALATLDEADLRLQQEQADAEIKAAGAALTQAEAELKRIATLRSEGWSTASGFDRQKAAAEEARGRLVRGERALSLARNALSYATLVADADGVVTATNVEPGQVVTIGQAAVRLARTGEKDAVVAIPEILVGQVREGTASVALWSDPDRRLPARLRELSPSADATTRTYLARYALTDAGDAAQLGMTATVTIGSPADARVARLPLSALYNDGAGPAVWRVASDGALVLSRVVVAAYEARDVLITGGVDEGVPVVSLGVQKLDAGQKVRVVEALRF
ncbi:MAG TPA: efflux RND transporter periplasmic adaptor subunit [Beijerinckiaceae bacterium]|nr:efflux RND transporter periplasmic adaptor subunit [Beijerinckiaceae bacterium]